MKIKINFEKVPGGEYVVSEIGRIKANWFLEFAEIKAQLMVMASDILWMTDVSSLSFVLENGVNVNIRVYSDKFSCPRGVTQTICVQEILSRSYALDKLQGDIKKAVITNEREEIWQRPH